MVWSEGIYSVLLFSGGYATEFVYFFPLLRIAKLEHTL